MRVFLASLLVALCPVGVASAAEPTAAPASTTPVTAEPVPESTINDFIPEDRAISDCISAAPKPGCGSESRSDWHQFLVLGVLAIGMTIIGWRIVAGLRRAPS